jgi:hypothetical protein
MSILPTAGNCKSVPDNIIPIPKFIQACPVVPKLNYMEKQTDRHYLYAFISCTSYKEHIQNTYKKIREDELNRIYTILQERNTHIILVTKPETKSPKIQAEEEEHIKQVLKETECEGMDCILIARGKTQQEAFVATAMNL